MNKWRTEPMPVEDYLFKCKGWNGAVESWMGLKTVKIGEGENGEIRREKEKFWRDGSTRYQCKIWVHILDVRAARFAKW